MIKVLARPLQNGVGIVTQWFGQDKRWGTSSVDYSWIKWRAENGVLQPCAGHNGIDYGVKIGTAVFAATDGIVDTGNDPGYGKYIRITNVDMRLVTIYAHLSEFAVADGVRVKANQMIATSGNSGNSSGPHLHFGAKWLSGKNQPYLDWVDPVPLRG